MKNKKAILKLADLMGYEIKEENCNFLSIVKNEVKIIYNPFLLENARQREELIEHPEIMTDIFYYEHTNKWCCYISGEQKGIHKSRHIAIFKALCALVDEVFEE